MKQSKFIKKCGPYEVHSISQDGQGVRLEVFPAFPVHDGKQFDSTKWAINRLLLKRGGGPGIFTAIGLAQEFEDFLNQPYSEAEIKEWKSTLDKALGKVRKQVKKKFDRAMAKQMKKSC